MLWDFVHLRQNKNILRLDNIIGVVPVEYMFFHHFGSSSGITLNPDHPGVSVVYEIATSILPHELSHQFGVNTEYYDETTNYYNGPTNSEGFNARTNVAVKNNKSFMCAEFATLTGIWTDQTKYATAFSYVLNPPNDPSVISVSGILQKNGAFAFGPSVQIQNGVATTSIPAGDLTFRALDANGVELSSVTIQSDYQMLVAYAEGKTGPTNIDVGAMPVVITLPYNDKIADFQVLKSGIEIAKTSVDAQSLQQIIESIPYTAFKQVPFCKDSSLKVSAS